MEAKGKMRVRGPIVVRPATATWLIELAAVAELDLGADHAERADLRRPRRSSRRPRRRRSDE